MRPSVIRGGRLLQNSKKSRDILINERLLIVLNISTSISKAYLEKKILEQNLSFEID